MFYPLKWVSHTWHWSTECFLSLSHGVLHISAELQLFFSSEISLPRHTSGSLSWTTPAMTLKVSCTSVCKRKSDQVGRKTWNTFKKTQRKISLANVFEDGNTDAFVRPHWLGGFKTTSTETKSRRRPKYIKTETRPTVWRIATKPKTRQGETIQTKTRVTPTVHACMHLKEAEYHGKIVLN